MQILSTAASILSPLANAPASSWVDLACLVAVATCVIWGAVRGFSATLAQVAALVVSFKLSFSVCPWVRSALSAVRAGGRDIAGLLPFLAALVLLVILFLLLRLVFEKFIQVMVPSPADNVLGGIAGLLKGLLAVFLAFAIARVALGRSYAGSAFGSSRTGQRVFPVLEKVVSSSYRAQSGSK